MTARRTTAPAGCGCTWRATATAGDALARKFTALVRSIVQRVLGPGRREEWDDACQAVFLRVFTNLGKWEERCPFCKWLAVVAARRAIDLCPPDRPDAAAAGRRDRRPAPAAARP